MKRPQVSVIIPVFNREKFIKDAIISILGQNHNDWECVVVDDGSNDNTQEIVRSFAMKDHRVFLYPRDRMPKGANTCRNIGLERANGYYIMFLDSDDVLATNCLKNRLGAVSKLHLDVGIFSMGKMTESGKMTSHIVNKYFNASESYFQALLSGRNPWTISSQLWSKEFIGDTRFDESLCRYQDTDFHLRLLLKRPNLKNFPDLIDCYYRTHGGGGFGKTSVAEGGNQLIIKFVKSRQAFCVVFENLDVNKCINRFVQRHFISVMLFRLNCSIKEIENYLNQIEELDKDRVVNYRRILSYLFFERISMTKFPGVRRLVQLAIFGRNYF